MPCPLPLCRPFRAIVCVAVLLICPAMSLFAAELQVGGATISITPEGPVALSGQMHARIAQNVEAEVTATALALESREGEKPLDQAIFVSCDLVLIRDVIRTKVRERIKDQIPDFDVSKLVISATHTHTAPLTREGLYKIPAEGVVQPKDYIEFLSDRIAEIVVKAWQSRQPGSVGWGLGHAVVAQNRRATYADGSAQMYGSTNNPNFRGIEGYEDHDVHVLCFWNAEGKLIATAINVACPAQEVEGRSAVNADFWHNVRESLRAKHGKDLLVLGWTGAAGDQSPHLMYNQAAEERMRNLRGLTRLEELARRIVAGWEEAYAGANEERHSDAVLIHHVQTIDLPERMVTQAEALDLKRRIGLLASDASQVTHRRWLQLAADRYDRQQAEGAKPYQMELHAIRLGDVAIVTNEFELFTEYGIQIKARSPALQTFIIQQAGQTAYIPTPRAAQGGGYSAIVESNDVGAEGGQVLVERTVEAINALWSAK